MYVCVFACVHACTCVETETEIETQRERVCCVPRLLFCAFKLVRMNLPMNCRVVVYVYLTSIRPACMLLLDCCQLAFSLKHTAQLMTI